MVNAREEVLEGNKLSDFPKKPGEPVSFARGASPASAVRGKDLYFLNVSDKSTVLTFCASENTKTGLCDKKGTKTSHFTVNPKQSLLLKVGNLRGRYLLIESSSPGFAIIGVLKAVAGTTRVFGTNSTIDFGDPVQ